MDKKTEKQNFIIEQALQVLEQYGLRKTTMEDIAQRCGLRKASLYYYFKSKEDIVSEMIRRFSREKMAVLKAVDHETPSAADAIRDTFESLLQLDEKLLTFVRIALGDPSTFMPLARETTREMDREMIGFLLSILRRGFESGEFRDHDSNKVAEVFLYLIRTFHMHAGLNFIEHPIEKVKSDVSCTCELILDGLRAI